MATMLLRDLSASFSPSLGLGYGVLLYCSVPCLIVALLPYGDREIVAFPSLRFQRHYTVCCPLNPIDLVEHRYTKR